MPTKFYLYLAILEAWILAELGAAYVDKYAFKFQILTLRPVPDTFLAFWDNWAMRSCFIIVSPILAYMLTMHAKSWSLEGFAVIFLIAAIALILARLPLLEDSLKTPSALFRNGLSPIAGVMEYLYQVVSYSVIGSYYFLTPRGQATPREVIAITVLLMLHSAIMMMHPPYAVHGSVHTPAKVFTAIYWIVLPLFALYLIFLA